MDLKELEKEVKEQGKRIDAIEKRHKEEDKQLIRTIPKRKREQRKPREHKPVKFGDS